MRVNSCFIDCVCVCVCVCLSLSLSLALSLALSLSLSLPLSLSPSFPCLCLIRYGTFATGGCDGLVNVWDGVNKKRVYQVRSPLHNDECSSLKRLAHLQFTGDVMHTHTHPRAFVPLAAFFSSTSLSRAFHRWHSITMERCLQLPSLTPLRRAIRSKLIA